MNPKIFIVGLPLFVVQLIVVYFITANILIEKFEAQHAQEEIIGEIISDEPAEQSDEGEKSENNIEYGKYIHTIDDIIVNPANTTGEQLLLTSLAFDLGSEENQKELVTKDILVKDMVLSILSSKTTSELSNNKFKDSLRVEIADRVQANFPDLVINKIYFSKYILN
ncbi:MAG: flagellar basal body-associated FliL family protein [Melioribacteraceae bacterium]|nr:flagellar basal body-associated FliL family protein [Melioribacteraceae bacterium]